MSTQHPWPGSVTPPGATPQAPMAQRGVPVPPASVIAAAVLAVVGVVGVLLAAAVGDLQDLVAPLKWRDGDADTVLGVVTVALVALLSAGAVAGVCRRGGGLLRAAGVALAVPAVGVVVAELVDGGEPVRIAVGALMAAAGVSIAVLAAVQPSRRWFELGERLAAERAIDRALRSAGSGGMTSIAGRGLGWALAAAAFGAVVVAASAVVVAQTAPPLVGEDAAQPVRSGSDSGDGSEVPVDTWDDEWDPYYDDLAEECADGRLSSCDDLYFVSDIGSDYEEFGSTCGGRTSVRYSGDCADEFD